MAVTNGRAHNQLVQYSMLFSSSCLISTIISNVMCSSAIIIVVVVIVLFLTVAVAVVVVAVAAALVVVVTVIFHVRESIFRKN